MCDEERIARFDSLPSEGFCGVLGQRREQGQLHNLGGPVFQNAEGFQDGDGGALNKVGGPSERGACDSVQVCAPNAGLG